MSNLFDLTGKVALVVGVGGIGHAQAVGFADYGADVVVADFNPKLADKAAEDIRAKGKRSLPITIDVTKQQSVEDMVKQALKEFSHIDILANSFGVNKPAVPSSSMIENWQQIMDVNYRGVFLCCYTVGQEMVKQQSGKIINISSIRGRFSVGKIVKPSDPKLWDEEKFMASLGSYGPAKGAIDTLTRNLACSWAEHNVLVNAIAPGVVDTEIMRFPLSRPDEAERIKSRIPLGRIAQPEEIVGLSVFLASKASDYITGQIINFDGGNTAWN